MPEQLIADVRAPGRLAFTHHESGKPSAARRNTDSLGGQQEKTHPEAFGTDAARLRALRGTVCWLGVPVLRPSPY